MTCNEARRKITSYVKKELSDRETEQFLHHIERCSDCMDELDTYYTVYQALDLLDSGNHHSYDFKKMLREDIRSSQLRLVRRRAAAILGWIMIALTELLLVISLYTAYEAERGNTSTPLIQRAILRLHDRGFVIEELEEAEQETGAQGELHQNGVHSESGQSERLPGQTEALQMEQQSLQNPGEVQGQQSLQNLEEAQGQQDLQNPEKAQGQQGFQNPEEQRIQNPGSGEAAD